MDIFSFPTITEAVEAVFSEGGPITDAGFEIRESQKRLALATAARIDEGDGWSLGEAPCGTGKGLAYLIPGVIAAMRAERRCDAAHRAANGGRGSAETFPKLVVATANIALQEQLVTKDIPAVGRLLGVNVRGTLYKGRRNYLCRLALREAETKQAIAPTPGWKVIRRWAADTETGDREELTFDPGPMWADVSTDSDGCAGRNCPMYSDCYVERARRGAARAHVVVANHAFLPFLGGKFDAVCLAVDEAHELEGYLRGFASREIRERTAEHLANRMKRFIPESIVRDVRLAVDRVFDSAAQWWNRKAGQWDRELRFAPGWYNGPDPIPALDRAIRVLGDAQAAEEDKVTATKIGKAAKSVGKLREVIETSVNVEPTADLKQMAPGPWAIWMSKDSRGRFEMSIAPADISEVTRLVRDAFPAAILTSATLAINGKLTYTRNTLGLQQEHVAEELALPSPYPLQQMGALLVPSGPSPKQRTRWEPWAADQVVDLVNRAGGRTLVLCSSNKMKRRYAEALRDRTSWPVKVQGEEGRSALRKWFTETTEGVLVATRSFFQGLDVQGDSLVQVIIDRIPFTPPGDPLEEAVGALLVQKHGGSAFKQRALPAACMAAAQGAGRLIRSQSDRGVVVCLDSRVAQSGMMGRCLRGALPPFPLTRDMGALERVLEGEGVTSALHQQSKPRLARRRGL